MQRLSSPALMCVLSCFSRVRLFATPWLRVHELLQARILEWVTVPSSRGSFRFRDRTRVSYIFTTSTAWEAQKVIQEALHHLASLVTLREEDDSADPSGSATGRSLGQQGP